MTIHTRLAAPADAPDIGLMIDALDTHYHGAGKTRGVDAATAMVRRALGESEGTRFLLAYEGTHVIGLACFAIIRPGRLLGGLIFLKDLFVVPSHRSRGAGAALMNALAAYARDNDIDRIDLNTSHDNTGAQKLYERLGASREDAIRYRFDGESLAALAAKADDQ